MLEQETNSSARDAKKKDSFSLYADCLAKRLLFEGVITSEQYDKLLEINKNLNIHTS